MSPTDATDRAPLPSTPWELGVDILRRQGFLAVLLAALLYANFHDKEVNEPKRLDQIQRGYENIGVQYEQREIARTKATENFIGFLKEQAALSREVLELNKRQLDTMSDRQRSVEKIVDELRLNRAVMQQMGKPAAQHVSPQTQGKQPTPKQPND